MKYSVIALALVATTASADMTQPTMAQSVNGTVQDHYQTVTRQIPHTERVCTTVEVPVYGQGGDDIGSFIMGGVIGSAVGNQMSGADGAGAIGAIVGGAIANEHQKKHNGRVVGYRQEQRCQNQTTYSTVTEEVYKYSTMSFIQNGKAYTVRFTK